MKWHHFCNIIAKESPRGFPWPLVILYNSWNFDVRSQGWYEMKRGLVIVSLLALAGLAGCSNTFNGIGQDLEKNGQAIQRQF